MSKTITISGLVSTGCDSDGHSRYYLVQPDGYRIDMVARVAEIADYMGGVMSGTWWVSDAPKTKDEMVEGFLARVYGDVDSRNWEEEYHYSSYTHGSYTRETCEIGGHSLISDFSANDGRFMLFEFTDNKE